MKNTAEKPELLIPAGDFDKLKTAFHFGADAVYAGMKQFSLRANSRNFDREMLSEAVEYTHKLGKKIYIAVNIYFTPGQAEEYKEQLQFLQEIKPDGLIISDMGGVYLAKQYAPDIPIHLSTQANTTNQYAARFYQDNGIGRIVTARELSLKDISLIKKETGIQIESFIHGAMCIAYSGRCLLSSYMTRDKLGIRENEQKKKVRSANQGDCSHSCRWEYLLIEKSRKNQQFDINEEQEGTYILSSKDICMIDYIQELIEAGVNSFKIEGRMKSLLYISSITRAYRQAIDVLFDPSVPYDREAIEKELNIVSHRDFCTGYYFDSPREEAHLTGNIMYTRKTRLAALVEKVTRTETLLKVYNTITLGTRLELIAPDMKTIPIGSIKLYDKDKKAVEFAHHSTQTSIELFDKEGKPVIPAQFDILRMEYEF